jgi:serine phosphatase RsbU (regulator of sigma subunit)
LKARDERRSNILSAHEALEQQTLQCMEIWGGIEPVERSISTPGLDLWVFSQPYRGEDRGGDVYYVTLCGGGVITRLVVADVSGHGSAVAEFSSTLRGLLRKNINQKSQKRLVESLNREFGEMAQLRRFATTVVITYLASTGRMSISNAGHPRPLLFRAVENRWSLLREFDDERGSSNLPLGLEEETRYHTFGLELARGDLVVLYTDALSETADPSGALLGETGLLQSARELDSLASPATVGKALLQKIARYRRTASAEDDATLLVLFHNGAGARRLSLGEKLDVYAKVFGLKPV